MKQTIKNQMFWMLQDVITHFGSNPKVNRAITFSGMCKYSRTNSENIGCAIGMYLSDKITKELDNKDTSFIIDLIEEEQEKFPKWMQAMDTRFLSDLQFFHDTDFYWDLENNCISKEGMEKIELICNDYDLPFKELEFPKR